MSRCSWEGFYISCCSLEGLAMKNKFRKLPVLHVENYANYGDVRNASIPGAKIHFNNAISKMKPEHKRMICDLQKTFNKPYILIYEC